MSVQFSTIEFRNNNSIEVILTIEAPIGSPVDRPRTVNANSLATINPAVDNCRSVLLAIRDTAHGTTKQTFAMGAPNADEGRYAYFESMEMDYSIGDFTASIHSRTG